MDNIRRTFPRNGERILRSLAWALTLTGLSVDASLAQSSTGSVNGELLRIPAVWRSRARR